jgi:hypothetical protein
MLDAILSEVARTNGGVRITLAPDLQTARAAMRFRASCADDISCKAHFGPFASYIHREVCLWDESIFEETPDQDAVSFGRHSIDAFTDGNLVVMKRGANEAYSATVMHEAEHQLFRAGQQLRADDGRWLQVKRDVPTTSASTYLHLLENWRKTSSSVTDLGTPLPFYQ